MDEGIRMLLILVKKRLTKRFQVFSKFDSGSYCTDKVHYNKKKIIFTQIHNGEINIFHFSHKGAAYSSIMLTW